MEKQFYELSKEEKQVSVAGKSFEDLTKEQQLFVLWQKPHKTKADFDLYAEIHKAHNEETLAKIKIANEQYEAEQEVLRKKYCK